MRIMYWLLPAVLIAAGCSGESAFHPLAPSTVASIHNPNHECEGRLRPVQAVLRPDWGQLLLRVEVCAFTVTQESDLQLIFGLRNNANGESAILQSPLDGGTVEANGRTITIARTMLSRDWTRLVLHVSLSGFTVSGVEDLSGLVGLRNRGNGESAILQFPISDVSRR